MAEIKPEDADGTDIAPDGRVMEMLSEHTLEGWIEGYILTGRHGLFNTYEAFAHVIDSMYNQHAKWLEKSKLELDWRASISSLNLLISSLVWRQDHNGFTHEDPGFWMSSATRAPISPASIFRPTPIVSSAWPITACAVNTTSTSLLPTSSRIWSISIWTPRIIHCTKGIGIWDWASNDAGVEPDVVIASAGDILTQEALAAVAILRESIAGSEDPLR